MERYSENVAEINDADSPHDLIAGIEGFTNLPNSNLEEGLNKAKKHPENYVE